MDNGEQILRHITYFGGGRYHALSLLGTTGNKDYVDTKCSFRVAVASGRRKLNIFVHRDTWKIILIINPLCTKTLSRAAHGIWDG